MLIHVHINVFVCLVEEDEDIECGLSGAKKKKKKKKKKSSGGSTTQGVVLHLFILYLYCLTLKTNFYLSVTNVF